MSRILPLVFGNSFFKWFHQIHLGTTLNSLTLWNFLPIINMDLTTLTIKNKLKFKHFLNNLNPQALIHTNFIICVPSSSCIHNSFTKSSTLPSNSPCMHKLFSDVLFLYVVYIKLSIIYSLI